MTIKTELGYIEITNEVMAGIGRLCGVFLLWGKGYDHPFHVGRAGTPAGPGEPVRAVSGYPKRRTAA